eukprot:TRINITY_DN16476_c0_g1_i2.p1 TRINITY_DN16476_c0_g1~~TRINITY_DN16476_c0_g1_i2.p1  ORF type:complete len:239 (-),score=47.09 TRINITY_DN16476_c0_g1_i2:197-808(-)
MVGLGLTLCVFSDRLLGFGLYLVFLALFHYFEFICVAMFNPSSLYNSSFLINHSNEYNIAAAASIIEFLIEFYFFPSIKSSYIIIIVGFIGTAIGFTIRVVALITAGHNFTHLVAEQKKDNHVLVTSGIYGVMRHPGYMGWFYYTIFSQVLLFNPICIAGFAYVSWRFFDDRIRREERHLIEFFGQQYNAYKAKVPTLIPFIK